MWRFSRGKMENSLFMSSKKEDAELPIIDAGGGGVSATAYICGKYLKLLRFGQYGQVGTDGI